MLTLVEPQPRFRNSVTAMTLEQTAWDRRLESVYRKTYDFPRDYIDGYHRWLGTSAPLDPELHILRIGIDGWMFRADALKLYEMAFFGRDVLELGTYKGLSTTIMATALFNSGEPGRIFTCDLIEDFMLEAREGMTRRGVLGRENVFFAVDDAGSFLRRQIRSNRRFRFVFVDHSHEYEPMLEACGMLADVTEPGAFVLFHDYNDPRNSDPEQTDYGVYQAVHEALPEVFEPWGVFGCTGLFRRRD
jgi:hypothetical protein